MSEYDHNKNDQQTALDMLDTFLFHNVFNAYLPGNADKYWQITFEGDNYVVRHWETKTDYHFRVTIEPYEWDSSQAISDQEWDLDD